MTNKPSSLTPTDMCRECWDERQEHSGPNGECQHGFEYTDDDGQDHFCECKQFVEPAPRLDQTTSSLTLADLEAVEKAGEKATERPWKAWADEGATHSICAINGDDDVYTHRQCVGTTTSPQQIPDAQFIALAANHAVEMSRALREATSVLVSVKWHYAHCKDADCDICHEFAGFRQNWPGLVGEKGGEG